MIKIFQTGKVWETIKPKLPTTPLDSLQPEILNWAESAPHPLTLATYSPTGWNMCPNVWMAIVWFQLSFSHKNIILQHFLYRPRIHKILLYMMQHNCMKALKVGDGKWKLGSLLQTMHTILELYTIWNLEIPIVDGCSNRVYQSKGQKKPRPSCSFLTNEVILRHVSIKVHQSFLYL